MSDFTGTSTPTECAHCSTSVGSVNTSKGDKSKTSANLSQKSPLPRFTRWALGALIAVLEHIFKNVDVRPVQVRFMLSTVSRHGAPVTYEPVEETLLREISRMGVTAFVEEQWAFDPVIVDEPHIVKMIGAYLTPRMLFERRNDLARMAALVAGLSGEELVRIEVCGVLVTAAWFA